MKLAKIHRDEFVEDVIADVKANMPKEPDARIREIFNQIDEQYMPASILAIKRKEPANFKSFIDLRNFSTNKIDRDALNYKKANYENDLHHLPMFVKAEHDERAMELCATIAEYREFDDVRYYDTFDVNWTEFALREDDISKGLGNHPDLVAELIELQIARYRWVIKMKNTKIALQNKIAQCKNLAEAKIMFPDLVSYLPEPPVKVVQLPVSPANDVLDALRGLGIPKEEAVAA